MAQVAVLGFEQYVTQDVLTLETSAPTTLGGCVVEINALPSPEYLNVAAEIPGLSTEPMWIVRNVRIHTPEEGVPMEILTCRFPMEDLGVEPGMMVAGVAYGWEISPLPLTDADAPAWMATLPLADVAPMDLTTIEVGPGVPPTALELSLSAPDDWFEVSAVPLSEWVYCNIGCNMPNIDLDAGADPNDKGACMPASCANSLQWLEDKHDQISIPHEKRSIMKQLGKLARRAYPQGVEPKDIARAKLDFIEAHKLPIHVKWSSPGFVDTP